MNQKFKFKDSIFELTTVNKQRTFYYRITKPIDVWGNYHTQIAFYDNRNNIVYHRQSCYAHSMESDNYFGFVKWSSSGQIALFYEFRRGSVPGDGIFDFIIIFLNEQVVHRLELYKHDHSFFDNFKDQETDDISIMEQLIELGIDGEETYADPISIDPIKWLTGVDRWRPVNHL